MGIIIDLILIAIIVISTFLGYKKGLVELGAKLFAGIIAIIITIVLYKPVSGLIINNTSIDENIEKTIISKTSDVIDGTQISNNQYIQDTANDVAKKQAQNITINIIYVVTALVLFIVIKIALSIIIKLADVVASLPILKQFNEVGGMVYGLARGILVVCVIVLLIGVSIKLNPDSNINNEIERTYLTKVLYNNIVKF